MEVKSKADSDDFESLNLEPPSPEEEAALSANFGHSRLLFVNLFLKSQFMNFEIKHFF